MEPQSKTQGRQGRSLSVFFLISGVVDLGSWIFIIAFLRDETWQGIFFFSRIAFVLIIFLRMRKLTEIDPDRKNIFIFFTLFFFSCFSLFGIITSLLLYRVIVKPSTDLSSLYHIDQEEGEEEFNDEKQDIQINLEELCNVSPLIDGLTDEEKNVRVAAILAMEEVDSQSTRQTLVSARKDTSKEVQYYANEAIKKISDMYFSRITEILKVVKKMKTPQYQKQKELADLYSQFAEANIEHPVIVESYRAKAINIYEELLKFFPEHRRDIVYQLIPALYYNRNYDLCIKYCFEIEENDENFEHVRSFKARAFFALRDIPALIQIRNDIKDLTVHPLEKPLGILSEA
jgi:tetratricopeptide (TPR) repeat protein